MRKSFTLIELLVVVAIIAVLVAMLLPALKMARESAYTVRCLNNLHQVAYALETYKTEFNKGPLGFRGWTYRPGWYPWTQDNDPFPRDMPNTYYPYFGWFSEETSDAYGKIAYGLGKYLRKSSSGESVVYCTKHQGEVGNFGQSAGYAVNFYLGYAAYLGTGIFLPDTTPVLMCGTGYRYLSGKYSFQYYFVPQNGYWGWGDFQFAGDEFLSMASFGHCGSGNFLFYDGHVVNQPAMGSIWDYRDKWTFWGYEGSH